MKEPNQIRALWVAVKALQRRLTSAAGGVPPSTHATNHSSGSSDPVDVTDLDGFPGGSPLTYLDSDGQFSSPASGGDVTGPGSSTDEAFARFSGTTGKVIQNSTDATLDDAGRATFKAIHIPMFDAGNSGTALTLDWDDGNEQTFTLTGNVVLDLDNPREGGRYVVVIDTGSGGFTVTWPASVLWPGGTPPTITTDASKFDLVTLIALAAGSPTVYLASINQDY